MKYVDIKGTNIKASRLALGCMRIGQMEVEAVEELIETALELGINFFDHATCYGNGEAETRFGEAFKQTGIKREDVYIQSKCGIYPERQEFDWSRESILSSVDGILQRLQMDYIDTLLLHRPDVIFEPEEVALAFDELEKSGKVRYFGVSNLGSMQIELLKKCVKQPLVFNQLQLSLEQSQLIDQALYVNDKRTDMSNIRDGSLLDYCRLKDITIQAWSPLQFGFFKGVFVDNEDFPELNRVLGNIASREGVSKSAIAIAWILRHPAKMQAVLGTMNVEHMKDVCEATKVNLSHHDWYQLYLAAGKFLP